MKTERYYVCDVCGDTIDLVHAANVKKRAQITCSIKSDFPWIPGRILCYKNTCSAKCWLQAVTKWYRDNSADPDLKIDDKNATFIKDLLTEIYGARKVTGKFGEKPRAYYLRPSPE